MHVDGEPFLVHHDMVVEPAQEGEIVGVVVAAPTPFSYVVGFEAVGRGAAVCGAAAVAEEHEVAGAIREPVAIGGDSFQAGCVDEGGLGFANTEDLFERVGPDIDAESRRCAGFALGSRSLVGVDEDVGLEPPWRRCRVAFGAVDMAGAGVERE